MPMDNATPDPQQLPDDLTSAADDAAQQLENATAGLDGIADNLGQTLEDGLNSAEQKFDDFMGGLDRFLGKF
jgi:uncharacterized phage infection (PIP) family protein YhgE